MAIKFFTANPQALLDSFHEKIQKSGKEGITTWEVVGEDFAHKAPQLVDKGLLRPVVEATKKPFNLTFLVKGPEKDAGVSKYVYAELQGNILSTFAQHFSEQFTSAEYTGR